MNTVMNFSVPHLPLSSMALRPVFWPWHPLSGVHDHTQTHRIQQESYGQGIVPTQWPRPDKAQRSRKTDIHAIGGIQPHNPRERVAADRCGVHSVMPFFVDSGSNCSDVCLCCMWWNAMINRSTVAGKHYHKYSLCPKRWTVVEYLVRYKISELLDYNRRRYKALHCTLLYLRDGRNLNAAKRT